MEKIHNNAKREKCSKLLPTSSPPSPGNGNEALLLTTSFLMPLRKSRISNMFNFHVFLLQTTFLSVCYYFLLVPFRHVRRQGRLSSPRRKEYFIQSNIFQQAFSTIFILILIIYSFLDIRSILATSLQEKPEKAFLYADTLCLRFFPVFWMATFWLKQKHFVKLLAVCQGKYQSLPLEQPVPPVVDAVLPKAPLIWLINLVLVSAIAKVVYTLVNMGYPRPDKILCIYGGQAMYILHLREKPDLLSFDELYNSKYVFGASIAATIISGILLLMEEFFDMFCVIGAIMMYAVCCHFFDKLEELTGQHGTDSQYLMQTLRELSRNYMDLAAISDTINAMFGTPVVLYYLSSYPTLVWMVFALFKNNDNPAFVLYCTHKIVIFIIFNAVASEGASKVQQYKKWLFEMSVSEFLCTDTEKKSHFRQNNENSKISQVGAPLLALPPTHPTFSCGATKIQPFLNIMHRQVNCEDVGLKGYKFFTVTYNLIGTMLGFIVTFAIVMLQFESDKKDGNKATSPFLSSSALHYETSNDTFADEIE